MNPILLILATLSVVPHEVAICDRVDVIEVNHYYDGNGELVFDQLIFYAWCNTQCRFQVVAWRYLVPPMKSPARDWPRREYVALWHEDLALRRVNSSSIRETWTQHDPEIQERSIFPMEDRRQLTPGARP